jgi:predicted LPLAT superfamily acyltransferase
MTSWDGKTRGGVTGYRIFVWTIKNTGLSFAYFLLHFVALYFLFTSGKAFPSIYTYFHRYLHFSRFRSLVNVYRNYNLFGRIILDKIALLAGFQHKFTFDFEGEEYLRQMDHGGLLISAHVGNWEIAGQLLNRLEKKIHIILFDAEHRRIQGYMSEVLTRRNVHFIIIREDQTHLQEIRAALEHGDIIAMHGDRFVEGNRTVSVPFLGQPALFPVGPVLMAAKFKVPVTWVFALKESRTHYHFYATPLKHIPYSGNLEKRKIYLEEAVQDYVATLERMVRKYPLQWFNYYDFWKVESSQPEQINPS